MVKAKRVKGLRCDAPVVDNARRIIDTRLGEMLSFAPWVDDQNNVEEIHNLRIAAKRLRYSLELFRFGLPSGAGGLIDEVKEIQEDIGDMHDADVMIERVLEIVNADLNSRAARLLEIAAAVDRGTVAQRHQRLRSATASRAMPRDEIAFFTLIAQRADDRDRAYERFIAAWRRMEETDFPSRLRRCIGALPAVESEPKPPINSEADEPIPEQAAG
ncbi:MAG: CHAD domain-containing protein [Thermomicrobiales bacterium]